MLDSELGELEDVLQVELGTLVSVSARSQAKSVVPVASSAAVAPASVSAESVGRTLATSASRQPGVTESPQSSAVDAITLVADSPAADNSSTSISVVTNQVDKAILHAVSFSGKITVRFLPTPVGKALT